ncbi:MAG: hypothetical protein AAFR38_13310 [Planctomycetota bacterium]
MSSFRSKDLFGSGPHRMVFARRGQLVVPWAVLLTDPSARGSDSVGDLEFEVAVFGRLVAPDLAGLLALREAIAAESAYATSTGTLVDTAGVSHSGMRLYRFEEGPRIDRGRVFSLSYEARFRRLAGPTP